MALRSRRPMFPSRDGSVGALLAPRRARAADASDASLVDAPRGEGPGVPPRRDAPLVLAPRARRTGLADGWVAAASSPRRGVACVGSSRCRRRRQRRRQRRRSGSRQRPSRRRCTWFHSFGSRGGLGAVRAPARWGRGGSGSGRERRAEEGEGCRGDPERGRRPASLSVNVVPRPLVGPVVEVPPNPGCRPRPPASRDAWSGGCRPAREAAEEREGPRRDRGSPRPGPHTRAAGPDASPARGRAGAGGGGRPGRRIRPVVGRGREATIRHRRRATGPGPDPGPPARGPDPTALGSGATCRSDGAGTGDARLVGMGGIEKPCGCERRSHPVLRLLPMTSHP